MIAKNQVVTKKLRKRFGQHLLVDNNTILDIVQTINPRPQQNICEIGPGLGAITVPALKQVGVLHAIEIDRDLSAELVKKCLSIGKLILHQTDVLQFDFNKISNLKQHCRLIGNLPYNISTPLLFHLLEFNHIEDIHFMLQKEVVDRITAKAGDSSYSRLSVMIQSHYKVESLFDIAPSMFSPPPKVTSSFMRLTPNHDLNKKIINRDSFNRLVGLAFHQRRKTIKNNLATLATEEQLKQASINPKQRPQEISIHQYIRLSNQLKI